MEKLFERPIYEQSRIDNQDGTYGADVVVGMSCPSNFEIMNKINEIVEWINKTDEYLTIMFDAMRNNPRNDYSDLEKRGTMYGVLGETDES